MNCSDLNFGRAYIIGSEYTLVDEFATYRQLKPTYLSEPIWGSINQIATYPVTSGGIDYYENTDEASVIADKSSYVYSDSQCQNIVQSVEPIINYNQHGEVESISYTSRVFVCGPKTLSAIIKPSHNSLIVSACLRMSLFLTNSCL